MPPIMRAGQQQRPSGQFFKDKPDIPLGGGGGGRGSSPRTARIGACILIVVLAVANLATYVGIVASPFKSMVREDETYNPQTKPPLTPTPHLPQKLTSSLSSTTTTQQQHSKNDATQIRHVYHAQPEETWKIRTVSSDFSTNDGSGSSSTNSINNDDSVDEQDAPEPAEEKDNADAIQDEIPTGDGHYDQADLTRPEEDDEGGDDGVDQSSGMVVNEGDDPVSREVQLAMENAKASGSMSLVPQIPKNKGKTFVYFRSKTCSYLCARAKVLGWKAGIVDLTNHVYPTMLLIRWTAYDRYRFLSRTIVNQVGAGSSCIGGGKGIQLLCRQQLASRHQCEYSDLGIQPKQWNIQKSTQCEDFFLTAGEPENADKVWIMKPGGSFHGKGITLHRGDDTHLRAKYGNCKKKLPEGVIIQEYIMKPALMQGHKFDLRSYLLIASTAPYLVFYHDGFARRSEHPFSMSGHNLTDVKAHITNDVSQSSENHFFSFEQLEASLHKEFSFPANYMENMFRPRAMRVTNYLFHTAVDRSGHKIEARPGRWQFFALDWMIDDEGKTHLLEANGDPTVKDYPGTSLTPRLWDSMFELVEMIHLKPDELANDAIISVKQRYAYKGWRLVYNQLEAASDPYNPCKFREYAKEKHPLYGF